MCRDSLTPNMRKEDEEIVAANSKEGDSTSTDDLLKQLIEVNEKQNELLEKNNKSSNILDKIIFGFSGLTLICALASANIASLQLGSSQALTGFAIISLTYILIFIGLIILGVIVFTNLFKEREKNVPIIRSILNILLISVIGLGIGLPIMLAILYQFDQKIVMTIIGAGYFVFCVMFGII